MRVRTRTSIFAISFLLTATAAFSQTSPSSSPSPSPSSPSSPQPVAAVAVSESNVPDVIISAGPSLDYATHQPSARVLIGPKVASPLGIPTFAVVSYEQNVFKRQPMNSNALTVRAGILQIPYHAKHWGVATLTDAGLVKFDLATLSTFTGELSVYWDVVGQFTKDKYHGWVGPVFREVSIAGMQVKPVYGLQLTTVFSKDK